MLSQNQYDRILPRLRLTRLVYAVMGLGIVAVMAVISILVDWKQLTTEAGYTSFLGALTGLVMFCASFVFPRLLTLDAAQIAAQLSQKHRATRIDDEPITKLVSGNLMLSKWMVVAMLEGGIFLNGITFFIEHATISISVIVIGLVIYLFRFPLVSRQVASVEQGLKDVQHELELIDIR